MDTTKLDSELDLTTDIAPNGDIILVVGPQNVRLRVHSQCLGCASKVFGIMFGPHWSEGQSLSKESPEEIRLEEDNAVALRTICSVIHHRNDAVPQVITPLEVLQIAIVADKYDLGLALKYATAQWLQPKGDLGKTEMGCLMAAAYIFGDMEVFLRSTLALIMDYEGSYLEFIENKTIYQSVPYQTAYLLQERRSQMRAEICQVLLDGQNDGCSQCGWGKTRKDRYSLLHMKYASLEMLKVPVSQIIREMEAVSCEDMTRRYHPSGLSSHYHEVPIYSQTLAGKLEVIKKRVRICLDCVRSGATAACKFQHE